MSWRSKAIIAMTLVTFGFMVFGMLNLDWGINEISVEFFVLGVASGIVGKLGLNGTARAFSAGFKDMVFAAVIVGLARGISSVLNEGQILDTIIYALFTPLQYLPSGLSAIGMMTAHAILHLPIPSTSGQAVLTMPILAPLSDLIGLSRQVCVLAYQYGGIIMDIIVPTNGALMAILLIVKIPYDEWFRFIYKKVLVMMGLGAIAIVIAIAIGY
ncbi:MAG: hypothetical protein O2887_13955 [Bacteroidetes bacterium]|nr:hypothetical protein [Bacteroidota bacterium]MDA1121573.1 hypothetical protein [Bacteroidota bacterium]